MKPTDESKILYTYSSDSYFLEQENRMLKETVAQLTGEVEKFKQNPLMVCEIREVVDESSVIIKIPNGNQFLVTVSPTCGALAAGDTVLVEQKNLTIVRKINQHKRFNVEQFIIMEKPTLQWEDVGGLDDQIRELKEVIELPLTQPELFRKVGITPAKGMLLHGPPGTGKTLLAKAVAASTNSTFIQIVGSELVQKFIGEGAKLVKEVFALAREKAPSIIFIDEIDALAANRIEVGTSGEREVQRTFMQFLAELDGFKPLGDVKVIGCTNRLDILDPAVIRPGRLDRLIEVPNPSQEGVLEILKIHTKSMSLEKSIVLEDLPRLMMEVSGADVRAMCTEAGYFAIRDNRMSIRLDDFVQAINKVKTESENQDFLRMYG